MTILSLENCNSFLSRGGFAPLARALELGGGVSNKVILAESSAFRVVLKQSLAQLQTAERWQADQARIFREAAAMDWLRSHGAAEYVPAILFQDHDNYTIIMEAAPEGAEMWKSRLFAGEFSRNTAHKAGSLLGAIISASWHDDAAASAFGDQTVFTQLRIDPYYRHAARQCPEASPYIESLIERSLTRRASLVHGDWSPKNLLVSEDRILAIDWEVIHFGDPSFDAAFLLNHLLMKSIAMPAHRGALAGLAQSFVNALTAGLPAGAEWVIPAALEHLPALLLARVEGKSPAEYLGPAMRARAKAMALDLMRKPAAAPLELFER